jgi:anaerobic magnesium-protoporphyrin IX monomethyl ester cyclase
LTDVVLIYPYFRTARDRSPFRFPPLGLGYIGSHLRNHGFSVSLVDCTFKSEDSVVRTVRGLNPSIIGIYSMFSLSASAFRLARLLREDCDLLVAGGPLPTVFPEDYLKAFDVVCIGEGEETMLELTEAHLKRRKLFNIEGICIRTSHEPNSTSDWTTRTPARPPIRDLDSIPFPARDLFDNTEYREYFRKRFGREETSIITTRGCPFDCDFCSRPIFSNQFRARSANNVVDELNQISELGYDSVWFSDDCFTLIPSRVLEICQGIKNTSLDLKWECLSRVDGFTLDMAKEMKAAGCERVFFGIESGDDGILRQMNKGIDVDQARKAVEAATEAELKAAGFFILGYPGEDDSTILRTIKFATRLPLDYASFSLPYPIPGTGLYDKVKDRLREQDWRDSSWRLIDHSLLYDSDFSEFKLKFAIAKAAIQHRVWKHGGKWGYKLFGTPFEALTDSAFRSLS